MSFCEQMEPRNPLGTLSEVPLKAVETAARALPADRTQKENRGEGRETPEPASCAQNLLVPAACGRKAAELTGRNPTSPAFKEAALFCFQSPNTYMC